MISFTLARKYARALIEIGLQERNYEALEEDLKKMADLLKANKELKAILLSSAYPVVTRKGIAREVSKVLGLSQSTIHFIDLLIERERMDHFQEIAKSYQNLCDSFSRRIRATLVTAMRLPPDLLSAIKRQFESSTGSAVILSVEEDPSLIGGILTRIGNVIYDGSLKTQLAKVKENLYKE